MRPEFDNADHDSPTRLSQTGQMLGWAVFGGLVLIGFFFGVVTGYERPKPPVAVAAAPKENSKPETPKPTPKITPEPQPIPPVTLPKKEEPKADPPKKAEPPKIDTPIPKKKNEPKTQELTPVSFQKDVLPIFRTYCLNCHGSGTGKPKGNVDLRTVASIMKGGGGPIIEVGKPEKSQLFTQIVDNAMPPDGKRPGKGETEVIRNWILAGAKPRRPNRKLTRPVSRSRPRTPRSCGRAN